MSDMLTALGAGPLLIVALLVWGFAPGLINRLIAMGFPKDDERRHQMIGDLYDVPRWEQPFWVLQQAERLLTEGVPARIRARRARSQTWRFDSGVRLHMRYRKTFMIPPASSRRDLPSGRWAKLFFVPPKSSPDGIAERLWVEVLGRARRGYLGRLVSAPLSGELNRGDVVLFASKQVIDVVFPASDTEVGDIAPDSGDPRENGNH